MKRRKFTLGLGAAAAGGASLIGSGAFTSVQADRAVTVTVADDTEALLGLVPTTEYATLEEAGTFTVDLSPDNPTDAGGTGVNANAETIIRDAFEIENRGTQTVQPSFEGGDSGGTGITLSDVDNDLTVTISSSEDVDAIDMILDPGDAVAYDVIVFTGEGVSLETGVSETVTVVAEAIEE